MEFSPAAGRLSERITLQPEGHVDSFAELSAPLRKGDVVFYRWNADAEVDFNIHSHRGEKVDYFIQSRAEGQEGDFHAPRKSHFYLMWQNPWKKSTVIDFEIWV